MGAVIKLPTAARRQVKQQSIRAVRAYKAANPWPGEHVPNHERERRARNALLEDMQRTPALLICMALLSNADDATRAKVAAIAELASLTRPDCTASQQALLLAHSLGGKSSPEARVINAACPNGEGR